MSGFFLFLGSIYLSVYTISATPQRAAFYRESGGEVEGGRKKAMDDQCSVKHRRIAALAQLSLIMDGMNNGIQSPLSTF